jgi:F-type H+-transporting ATPase subunit alpha
VRLTELLKQDQYKPFPVEEQVVSLFAGVRGYLDKLEVSAVRRFEEGVLRDLRAKHPQILAAIRDTGQMSKDTEAALVAAMDAFLKTFV